MIALPPPPLLRLGEIFSWIESDIIFFLLLVLVFFLHSIPLINWHVKGNFLNHFPLPPFWDQYENIFLTYAIPYNGLCCLFRPYKEQDWGYKISLQNQKDLFLNKPFIIYSCFSDLFFIIIFIPQHKCSNNCLDI